MRTRNVITVGMLLLGLSIAVSTVGQDAPRNPEWPQFRGPGRDGKSLETGLLKEWPQGGPKKLWSIDFLGEGFSSISVTVVVPPSAVWKENPEGSRGARAIEVTAPDPLLILAVGIISLTC